MLMSLSHVTMKTGLSVDFEDFFIFCFLKNNDLHFCHLVREKKSAWLGVSLIRTRFTHTLLPRKQHFVQDTGGTAKILYHSNTKQRRGQDDFWQSLLL